MSLSKNSDAERRQVGAPASEWRNFDRWAYVNYGNNKSIAIRAALIKATQNFDARFAGSLIKKDDGSYDHKKHLESIIEYVGHFLDLQKNCFVDMEHIFKASDKYNSELDPYAGKTYEMYEYIISDIGITLKCSYVPVGTEISDESNVEGIVANIVKNKGVVFFR